MLVFCKPPFGFLLHGLKRIGVYDRLMRFLNKILWKNAVVLFLPFRQVVFAVRFLQEQVPSVIDVPKHMSDNARIPFSSPVCKTVGIKPVGYCLGAPPRKILVENPPYDNSFIRQQDERPVHKAVAEQLPAPRPALLEIPFDAPFLILACGKALLLRERGKDLLKGEAANAPVSPPARTRQGWSASALPRLRRSVCSVLQRRRRSRDS